MPSPRPQVTLACSLLFYCFVLGAEFSRRVLVSILDTERFRVATFANLERCVLALIFAAVVSLLGLPGADLSLVRIFSTQLVRARARARFCCNRIYHIGFSIYNPRHARARMYVYVYHPMKILC